MIGNLRNLVDGGGHVRAVFSPRCGGWARLLEVVVLLFGVLTVRPTYKRTNLAS